MIGSARILICFAVGLTLTAAPLAGCGGGDADEDENATERAVDGTFVGKVEGTNAFVAVVAAPVTGKQEKRDVTVYVSDGRRLSEWFPASIAANEFSATSDDRDAKVDGKLSGKAVTGTLKLPGRKTVDYRARQATGPAGLYDLKVSAGGKLSGASAAGIGLKGETPFERGTGTLKLADGKKRRFDVTANAKAELSSVRAGQVRLIVLGDGELSGAGMRRSSAFLIRSL